MHKLSKSLIIICLSLIVCIVTSCDKNKNKTYEINYITSYGELGNAVNRYDGTTDILLPILNDSSYEFVGWYDNSNYSGNIITTIYKGETGNKTFFAKWIEKELPHEHNFLDGKCECGEVDPNYVPPHVHEFFEGKCSCGETDPNYVPPHVHEFFEGKCSCGEVDLNYVPPHVHEFIDGICECGEIDPNYVPPHVHKYENYICECGEIDPTYASENKLNAVGFDGNGMTYGIMVKDKSIVDPFDSNYKGINQALEQAHQKAVETVYNIKINYVEYDEEVTSGNEHVDYIKMGFVDKSLAKNNIFVFETSSDYITSLFHASCIARLYDLYLENGYFADYEYIQNGWINEVVSNRGNIYGYNPGSVYPDSYLCYNATKVKELGLEDPSEMWFKGEWTWDNFDSWVKSSSESLNSGEFVVDVRYADFLIGASSAQGVVLANQQRSVAQLSKSVPCTIVNNMKTYNEMGYLNNNRGLDDISNLFIQGDSLLHNGSTSILKALNNNSDVNFEVGIVPYPLKNDSIVTVYTEPYTYVDSLGNTVSINSPLKNRDGEVIKTSDGKDVYGIDLSQTRFYTSLTTIDCYGLINYPGDGIDGLDTSIAFSILHDLKSKNILIKETTTINDSQSDSINKEVINSISSKLYYDPINRISFNTAYYKGSQYSLPIVINDLVLSDKDTFEVLDEINHMYNELNYPIVW